MNADQRRDHAPANAHQPGATSSAQEALHTSTALSPGVVYGVEIIAGIATLALIGLTIGGTAVSEAVRWTSVGVLAAFGLVVAAVTPITRHRPDTAFAILMVGIMTVAGMILFLDSSSTIECTIVLFIAIAAITASTNLQIGFTSAALAIVIMVTSSVVGNANYDGGTAGGASSGLPIIALYAVVVTLLVDRIARDRRRLGRNMTRLYKAIQFGVSDSPNLGDNLDAIADTAARALNGSLALVLLRQDSSLSAFAPSSIAGDPIHGLATFPVNDDARGGPLAHAFLRRLPVTLGHLSANTQWPEWRDAWLSELTARNWQSVGAVPLSTRAECLGVLTVFSTRQKAFSTDDMAVLSAYAEQAALVILRAQAYEQERTAREELAEAHQLKDEFLAMVSHELRTPLTATKGFVDSTLLHWNKLDDERKRDLLQRASNNTDEINRLIGQLLNVARIDADRVTVRPATVRIRTLVEHVVSDLASLLDQRTVSIAIDPQLEAVTDPEVFHHVLVNLITNAKKFSPDGSTVFISAATDHAIVTLSVRDQGVGIAADELERVFERFFQSERTNVNRKGAGIGLAIARRFIEQQGGRIWAESAPGAGATFRFTLATPTTRTKLQPIDSNDVPA